MAENPLSSSNSDRSELLRRTIQLAMEASHTGSGVTEQRVAEILGELVRNKLLTAEESYAFRELLLQNNNIESKLDERIQEALNRQGIVLGEDDFQNLEERLNRLETNQSGNA